MEYRYMIFALLLLPLAAALGPMGGNGAPEGPYYEARTEVMGSAYENTVCKTDFMVGLLESTMENVNDSEELQGDIDSLEADMDVLQGYVDEGDIIGFRDYLQDEYSPHMRQAKENIMAKRQGVGGPARQQLREDYESLYDEYLSCNDESLGRFSEAKVNAFEAALDKAEERASALGEKGVDTGELTSLIEEARSEIVEPLQDALDSAEDGQDVRDAIKSYCLFNGCKEGVNFHFWVKFEALKLQAILDSIEADAEEAGLSDRVEDAREDLEAVDDSLEDVGTGQYPEGSGDPIAENLKSAAQTIKEILSALRSSS
ncbi:MAG: hypothetical protein V1827_00850 [Candidatus Micrarchaeota archaeon]